MNQTQFIMKRIIVLPLLLMLFALSSFGQKSNIIKLNLLSPILKTGNFAYERVLNENVGLQLRGYFSSFDIDDQPVSGFGIIPEARFYVANEKDAPQGFFVAPFVLYSSYDIESTVNDGLPEEYIAKGNLNNFGGGVVVGTQKVFSDIVTFEAFIGIKYTSGKVEVTEGDPDDISTDRLSGFLPRGGITLGILF